MMKGMELGRLKELGCNFVMSLPASSHMGGVWEGQIRTVRSVLTAILDQHATRLDTSSLRTFMYEVMAIINSRPLTLENIHDPMGPRAFDAKSHTDNEIQHHGTTSRRIFKAGSEFSS